MKQLPFLTHCFYIWKFLTFLLRIVTISHAQNHNFSWVHFSSSSTQFYKNIKCWIQFLLPICTLVRCYTPECGTLTMGYTQETWLSVYYHPLIVKFFKLSIGTHELVQWNLDLLSDSLHKTCTWSEVCYVLSYLGEGWSWTSVYWIFTWTMGLAYQCHL